MPQVYCVERMSGFNKEVSACLTYDRVKSIFFVGASTCRCPWVTAYLLQTLGG